MLTYKTIQEYQRYYVVDVYNGAQKLYRTTTDKKLPTDAENYRLIQKLDKPIVVTDEEKFSKNKGGKRKISEKNIDAVKESLKNKANTQQAICKKHCISVATLRKIKESMKEEFKIDRQYYGLDN